MEKKCANIVSRDGKLTPELGKRETGWPLANAVYDAERVPAVPPGVANASPALMTMMIRSNVCVPKYDSIQSRFHPKEMLFTSSNDSENISLWLDAMFGNLSLDSVGNP